MGIEKAKKMLDKLADSGEKLYMTECVAFLDAQMPRCPDVQ